MFIIYKELKELKNLMRNYLMRNVEMKWIDYFGKNFFFKVFDIFSYEGNVNLNYLDSFVLF